SCASRTTTRKPCDGRAGGKRRARRPPPSQPLPRAESGRSSIRPLGLLRTRAAGRASRRVQWMEAISSRNPAHGGADHAALGEDNISRLFAMTSDLLATISLDGHFTLVNPAWERLLGWTPDELLARPMQEFMHPDDVRETLEAMLASSGDDAQL